MNSEEVESETILLGYIAIFLNILGLIAFFAILAYVCWWVVWVFAFIGINAFKDDEKINERAPKIIAWSFVILMTFFWIWMATEIF